MENQVQNQNITTPAVPATDNLQAYVQKRRKMRNRLIIGACATLFVAVVGFFAYKNPQLFKAELTSVSVPGTLSDVLYIPNYSGGAGDEGNISIKAKNTVGTFNSMTFKLTYSPVNALIFDSSPIVFDGTTRFQSAGFQMASVSEPGSLVVTIILNSPITIPATPGTILSNDDTTHETLFKLATQINPALPTGQVITLGAQNVALLNGATQLATINSIVTGNITVESLNELKVLNTEVIDSTHVAVHFSDFISNMGTTASYVTSPALTVSNVESGTLYGFDQATVVLTTAAQIAVMEYVLTVNPIIPPATVTTTPLVKGNTQGAVKTGFRSAIFYGYGQATTALSDFGIESAAVPANSYNQVTVTFTDPVAIGSATIDDFSLTNITAGGSVIISDATTSGNQVTLTVNSNLFKKNTYLLSVTDPTDIQREGDGATLGINKVTFTGYKNGPRILSANVTQVIVPPVLPATTPTTQYKLQIAFDENIEALDYIGHLYRTGESAYTSVINSASEYNPVIEGQTLTLTSDIFNEPDSNFTFSVSSANNVTNTTGVPTDEAYKTITFWGYGHNVNTNKVGAVQTAKKNIVELTPFTGTGALNFTSVDAGEVSVFYYETTDTKGPDIISSVAVVGGNLKVTLANPLTPNKHYILRITDGTNTIVAKEFVAKQDLAVTSAEATASTKVLVGFSENLDEGSVQAADFVLDNLATVSTAVIQSDFQHVLLTTSALTTGTIYTVNAADTTPITDLIYAYTGANALGKSVGVFSGYGALAAQSTVQLTSATATSGTNVRLVFSGAVSDTTVTPINIDLVKIAAPVNQKLTITNITKINSTTFDLTTAKQGAGTNYFVLMKGVKDASSLLLGNARVLNFFGFQLPAITVSTIVPSTITNDIAHNIILSGQNLDTIETVQLNTQEVVVSAQTATSLTIAVPAGLTAGSYNITLINAEGETKLLSNAILVTAPATPLLIQGQAVPPNVMNNGTMTTKLSVLVTDPVGLASVTKVLVNLSQIGGPGSQEMTKTTGSQPLAGQWYTFDTTVPATVATSATPYSLPVQVKKGSVVLNGTIPVSVTNNIYQGIAPVINQAYVNPISVPPNGTTPVKVFAKVTDEDGVDTISSVMADLGALGVGFVELSPVGGEEAAADSVIELMTGYFQSEEFTVPTTTAIGAYTVTVSASDDTGEEASSTLTLNVSTATTGPTIGSTSYIGPQLSIPNDAETTFGIYAYVTDPDGVSDVANVTASFGNLGITPKTLLKDPNAGETAKSAWFSVEGLTVPKTAPFGVHDIEVIASDSQGAEANLILQLDVTYQDVYGDAPIIIQDRGYTTPRVAINDGQTPVTLYAFVRDDNDDIDSVVVNLSEIGQVGPEAGTGLTEVGTATPAPETGGAGSCPTGSNVIVCMNPSVREGTEGQWFILPGVTISTMTAPSSEPYEIQIVATDETNKTTYGTLPISVNDGEAFTNDKNPPKIVFGVATSATTVEVLFSEELSAATVSASGSEFTITDKDDINSQLAVVGATINASGTVVTLSTENQVTGKQYVVSASNEIQDAVGISLVAGSSNRAYFSGFKASGKVPTVDYVTATNFDTVEVEFQGNLKPTSLSTAPVTGEQLTIGGGDYNIAIYEDGTSEQLDVLGVQFTQGNVLTVKTAAQKNGQKYRMQIKGLASFDGKQTDAGSSKTFKGYNMTAVQHQAASNAADFNGDGKVDFTDFTIFSSVYGSVYYGLGGGTTDAATTETTGQPITPTPDALVPITSTPAGGDIPAE